MDIYIIDAHSVIFENVYNFEYNPHSYQNTELIIHLHYFPVNSNNPREATTFWFWSLLL